MKTNILEFNLMNNPVRAWIQESTEIKPFLTFANDKGNGRVLEIGCGNGHGIKLINKYFYPKQIIGIDVDEKMIEKAMSSKTSNTDFEVGDATKLRFPDNSFDSIFDFGVIHHIPNWKDSLNEMYRILKDGGRFFIEDFSTESFESPLGTLFKKFFDHPYKSMYSTGEFFDYINKVGFKIELKQQKNVLGLVNYFVVVCKK